MLAVNSQVMLTRLAMRACLGMKEVLQHAFGGLLTMVFVKWMNGRTDLVKCLPKWERKRVTVFVGRV